MFYRAFPGEPILPGVLILEALAQAMGFWRLKPMNFKVANYFTLRVLMKLVLNVLCCRRSMELSVTVIKERRAVTAFTGIGTVNGKAQKQN